MRNFTESRLARFVVTGALVLTLLWAGKSQLQQTWRTWRLRSTCSACRTYRSDVLADRQLGVQSKGVAENVLSQVISDARAVRLAANSSGYQDVADAAANLVNLTSPGTASASISALNSACKIH